MEIKDVAAIITAIATVIGAVAAVIEAIKIRRTRKKNTGSKKPWGFLISVFLMVVFAGSTLFLWFWKPPISDTSRYGFEKGSMGWVKQTWSTDQGVTAVNQSADQAKLGNFSLELITDLEGGHSNRSKGEAYVEIPIQNLEGKPITVWVYVPQEALGDPQIPNGIQVFVKDEFYKGEYGTWRDITPEKVDAWFQVTLMPSRTEPLGGYMHPEFNPTQIRVVGVKVAIGEGSTARYSGPIYVDAVDW